MNRSVVNTILAGSLIFLVALLGFLGYRTYKKVIVPRSMPSAVALTYVNDEPHVSESLVMSPSGVVSEVTIKNDTTDKIKEVDITDLQYDRAKVKGLPLVAKNIAPGKSVVLRIPVLGLAVASSDYTKLDYKYETAHGSGFASLETGYPPAPPAAKGKPKGKAATKGLVRI